MSEKDEKETREGRGGPSRRKEKATTVSDAGEAEQAFSSSVGVASMHARSGPGRPLEPALL